MDPKHLFPAPVEDPQLDAGGPFVGGDWRQQLGQAWDITERERFRHPDRVGRDPQLGQTSRFDLRYRLVGEQAAVEKVRIEFRGGSIGQAGRRHAAADDPNEDQQHREWDNDLVADGKPHGADPMIWPRSCGNRCTSPRSA